MPRRRLLLFSLVLTLGLLAGCASSPTDSDEYRDLNAELVEAHSRLDESDSELADVEAKLEQTSEDLADVRTRMRDLEQERDRALSEVEGLRLRYDDKIREELQSAYETEVQRACSEAAEAPARSVSSFVKFDDDWEHLGKTRDDLVAEAAACAEPQRQQAQLTQPEAAQALAPVAEMIMSAIRSGNVADDLDERVIDAASQVTRGAIFEDRTTDWVVALERIADGHACANFGCTWPSVIDDLMTIGVPGAPSRILPGGSRTVGDGEDDAPPGTWVTYQVDGCYWERLDDRGEIIDNNFVSSAPQVQVTIRAGDYAFNSEGCGRWMQF